MLATLLQGVGARGGHRRFLESSVNDDEIVERRPAGAFDPTGVIADLTRGWPAKI
ncbi:hypothetical protein ENTCAN_05234 [Enterobacter cancerogenus ATCC 35316]|nr:hypothetical protein ENTCAN_05234 [Enterobacter cancerogenus ATCC 35316]